MTALPRRAVRRLGLGVLFTALLPLNGCGDGTRMKNPEEAWTYAISQILIKPERRTKAEAYVMAKEIYERIRGGAKFAELAQARSEHEGSRACGGFMGFMNPHQETRFSGAVQALAVGQLAGPIETDLGYHVLYRHSYDEGRRLEARYYIPVYGFFVTSRAASGGADRSMKEARAIAQEAYGKVASGEIGLGEAAQRYGDGVRDRPDAFYGFVNGSAENRAVYEMLKDVEPGKLAPLGESSDSLAILVRGRHFRCLVRHILIRHNKSQSRDLNLIRSPEEAAVLAQQVRRELADDGSNWHEILLKYTEDAGTAAINGSLGAFTNGQLPISMENAILAAKPGEVSPIIGESPDGFHVLWRVD